MVRGTAIGLLAIVSLVAPSASAQEIRLSGPLIGSSGAEPPSYLPWWLRGDAVLAVEGHAMQGPGGSVRHRMSRNFAWDASFAYLRGLQDASARAVPIAVRAVLIDSRAPRVDWDFHLAFGPSFEYFTSESRRRSSFGGEVAFAVDRRVDPIFNRFLVEVVLDERHHSDEGWSTTWMLRVGIATTFGIRQYR